MERGCLGYRWQTQVLRPVAFFALLFKKQYLTTKNRQLTTDEK